MHQEEDCSSQIKGLMDTLLEKDQTIYCLIGIFLTISFLEQTMFIINATQLEWMKHLTSKNFFGFLHMKLTDSCLHDLHT